MKKTICDFCKGEIKNEHGIAIKINDSISIYIRHATENIEEERPEFGGVLHTRDICNGCVDRMIKEKYEKC